MEGGIGGAATKMRQDDDVRSETADIKLGAVSLISKPVEVKSEMTYNVRSEIVDIVLDAVVVASEPIEVISETTEISVDAQATGEHAMAALSVGLVVSFPLLTCWALKYKLISSSSSHDLVGQSTSSSMISYSSQTKSYTLHLLE